MQCHFIMQLKFGFHLGMCTDTCRLLYMNAVHAHNPLHVSVVWDSEKCYCPVLTLQRSCFRILEPISLTYCRVSVYCMIMHVHCIRNESYCFCILYCIYAFTVHHVHVVHTYGNIPLKMANMLTAT